MQTNSVFFAENGITATSANHIANLAKERVQRNLDYLNEVSFYDDEITLIGHDYKSKTNIGWTNDEVRNAKELLDDISQSYALIAWLREAIKAKEKLTKSLSDMDWESYACSNDIPYPTEPQTYRNISVDDYIDTLNVKERNRIFSLKAMCSVYGKYVHPSGAFSNARKKMSTIANNPTKIDGNGRDTIIHTRTCSCGSSVVEEAFFDMQNEHRSIQAELNGIMHNIEEKVREINEKGIKDYQCALELYNNQVEEIQTKFRLWFSEESAYISNLKIVIPNELKGIYDTVNSLGK